jgi:hypothetical protein
MIPYAELEQAIARWKARQSGVPQPAPSVASGTVEAEVPVSTAPEGGDGTVADESGYSSSGTIEITRD